MCRDYVVEYLGAPDSVLIVDEAGLFKKGVLSAGVARQYGGTAGRIENAQIGVFLAYATSKGHALIDSELYLPRKEWCANNVRRAEAAISGAAAFATKPELARQMIDRALAAGVPCAWVLGDEIYGSDRSLTDAACRSAPSSTAPAQGPQADAPNARSGLRRAAQAS